MIKQKLYILIASLLLCCVPAQAVTYGSFINESESPAATVLPDIDPYSLIPAPTFISDIAAETPLPEPDPDIPVSSYRDDGVLRVYLKSLNAPQQLNITLDGVYTVEHDAGFRFDTGAQISLTGIDGRIYLHAGGLTIDMGPSLTLTRQASEDAAGNGLYIEESEKDTLYCGDLSVSINSTGGLRAVLSINMEDYLRGVIAYEMSDSWPLEALKAQAVAARTYAMQRKTNAGARDYDLVDTTADQVFKGFDPEYENVIRAVAETGGIVGTYRGDFPTCYYTASNGGETALPSEIWSDDGDYGYLARTADPYDLENRLSMVNSVSFGADAEGCDALKAMLQSELDAIAEARNRQAEALEFESILSVEPVDPVSEGSIMCRTLRFRITATGLIPAAEAEESKSTGLASLFGFLSAKPRTPKPERASLNEVFVIDLPVYEQIKDALNLGINSGDYEIVSAEKTDEGFTVSLRRFGHGVGMSQRGAQTMAGSYEKKYTEILNFYYPGMTLERIEWDTPALEALDDLPLSFGFDRPDPTPAPTPLPLPALQDGERYASVIATTLNVRQFPSTSSQIAEQLDSGRRLIVCSEADAEGWVRIRTAEISGYVKLEYLKMD